MDFKWDEIWWTWHDFQTGTEIKCWYYWGLHDTFQCELLQIHENRCREFQETQRKLPNEKELVNKAKPNNHKNSVHILSRYFLVLYISCFDNHFNCYHTSVQEYDNTKIITTIYHFHWHSFYWKMLLHFFFQMDSSSFQENIYFNLPSLSWAKSFSLYSDKTSN